MKVKSINEKTKSLKETEAEIMRVHNLFWESFAKRDIDLRFSLCSDDVTFIGSGLHERAKNKEEYKKINERGVNQYPNPFNIDFLWTDISIINNNVACVESEVIWSQLINNEMSKELLRNTTLLKYIHYKWLITHVHGSVPDYRLKDGNYMTNEQTIIRNIELERQVFERTEELNKTLKEIEQKNHELEIESALEKVRTIAMGIRQPDDMLDVCKTISLQLQSLGVKEIRNVQTAIFYEQRGTYMNYEFYAKHSKTFITETIFTNHEIHNEFAIQMLKGKGEVFITHINGDEVKDWIAYQKTTNVFIDKYLETASSLNYYWFSLGPVALGISTYIPLTEDEINLFRRFLKVFELAYQRYLDIEQAEAQAREAQIEASLERVRAVAMSMSKSDDLLSICEICFNEFKKLGFENLRNVVIHIPNDEKKYFLDYDFSDFLGGSINNIRYDSHPVVENYLEQIKKADDAFAEVIVSGKDLDSWKDFRRRGGQLDDPRLNGISALYYYLYSIGIGDIGISTLKSIDESQIKILKRFRNVFDLAYRRYTDIALAEAQAREAKIEAALEKVRASAMSMIKPDDLLNVCEILFTEFHKLGFDELRNAMINIHNDDNKTFLNYDYSDEIGKSVTLLDFNAHPVMEKQIKQSRMANDAFSEAVYKGKDLEAWKEFRRKYGEKDDPRIENITALYYYFYSIGNGTIGISTFSPIGEEKLSLLKRFRNVFSLAFRRYSDLALAEAQAREAQIELALERVRARTMAMQKSEELKEVIRVVYAQFVHLKINVDHAGFVVDYTPKGDWHFWIADEQDIPSKITHPYFESVWAHQFNEAKAKGIDYFATNLNFEEKNKFYNELLSYVPGLPQASKDFYLSCPGLAATTVLFDDVSLYIENFSGTPYSDEDNKILMRFGKVFQQTYTRFLDLQKAEAQAREVQIELALERVRARTMAMHKSEELSETAHELFQQFKEIDKEPKMLTIGLINENEGLIEFWVTDWSGGGSKVNRKFNASIDEPILLNKIYTAWREKRKSIVIELPSKELQGWVKYRISLSGIPDDNNYSNSHGFVAAAFFSKGMLSISTYEPLSTETVQLLERFAGVFNLTYTRFLDLQKAEAQAREAQIEASLEKVRSSAMAMHNSNDISSTTTVVFEELRRLNIESKRCGIALLSGNSYMGHVYAAATSSDGKFLTLRRSIDMTQHQSLQQQYESWKKQENYFIEMKGEELKSYYQLPFFYSSPDYVPPEKYERTEYGYYIPFSEGLFYAWTENPYTENEIDILKRFKRIVDLTFRRFFDLQKAEAQAKEAQIETALERVRSKAMAMYNSNDLSETVSAFFNELRLLNVLPWRCGVGQISEETKTTFLTTTSNTINGESFEVTGTLQQEGHPVLDGIFEHWKLQKEYYPVLRGDEIRKYYEIIRPQIAYPKYPLDAIQYGHFIFIKEGFVFAWTENKLSEEELSIFRRFASVLSLTYRRYLDLKEAEERNKIIQAENDRKTKELEEARQLQLSLLPRTLPRLPQYDIAVYMKTATEVGGDYYDFNVQENGVLNVGFGDATGHGLQAGTMITLMKGFFTTDAARLSPHTFLEHCNGMIRDIKLGRILMSFSHLRFENSKLLISSAGMPPVYYHHKKNNRTEEIIIRGLPLGAIRSASYKFVEKQLNSGDTILLLTDGLPEQMNNHKVIFDYSRVLKYFDEIAENTPDEIINRLVQEADEWMDRQPQTDDMTFVVIRFL